MWWPRHALPDFINTKETNALLDAVAKATTVQRLLEIEKSRHLGLNTELLTLKQARRTQAVIDTKQAEISAKSKAA